MHAELPKKGALASLKAFTAEYTMIVISILTALGLEHAATNWHRKHQAHEAEQRIEVEIALNLTEVKRSIERNDSRLKKYKELKEVLLDGINKAAEQTGQGKAEAKAELNRQIHAKMLDNFNVSADIPSLRREAWDVAVASQAASWIDTDQLQRYTAIYAQQREILPILSSTMNTIVGPRVMGALPRFQLRDSQQASDLYDVVSELCFSLEIIQSSNKELEKSMTKAAHKS